MGTFFVHQMLEEKVAILRNQEELDKILELLQVFSEAQDLVNRVIPLYVPNEKSSLPVLLLRMEAREEMLFKLMKSYLSNTYFKQIIGVPISLN